MKIAVAPNLKKKQAQACTEEALRILKANGVEAVLLQGLYQEGLRRQSAVDAIAGCDLVLAIGGDGTIICAAKAAALHHKPVLGINAGKLGFTAGLERSQLCLLRELSESGLPEEQRMLLRVALSGREGVQSFHALNDVVVSAELATIIDYQMSIGDNPGYHYRADGFIVATPTGCTAYSLSAGGPVVEPTLDCMIYTPICPHSLFNRSVVFSPQARLVVDIPQNRGKLFLTVDGEPPVLLQAGDRLEFTRSGRTARFIKLTESNFYDILNQKLLENG